MSFQDVAKDKEASSSSASPSQAVAAGIFQINTSVAAFRRLVDAVGTAKDTPDHRRKLHSTRQRILQLVKDTSAKLKSLTESDRHSTVHTSKKIEDAKLARDFQTALQEFQKVQQLASHRESSFTPSPSPSPSLQQTTTSSASSAQSSLDHSPHQPFLVEQHHKRQELVLLDNEIAFNEAIIEEREQGIKDIQEQIGEANEIFKDLAVLVHEQGIVIDDIQSNIDSSSGATAQARAQLGKASKSGKSRASWCWWVLVIFVVALLVFLLVLIL
ncbi:t-SNARE [Trema orientale]|uniref:t-SNARE n=1 Tax=Trema orientale TaxID=63057 RepID=A0A2P5BNY0_TREOI|nr:t-SNARE [Trema orientale]